MNNFKSGKSLFGISSSSSSSGGLYVDLLTNQSINGIKTFLSNLITNSNVNFNTSANVGRIVFKPNEPVGFGNNLLTIYTEDENDGQGWIFSDGSLYYLGIGLSPIKIIFEPTGNITAIGNISSANVLCDTIQSFSGGNITINNNLALGSNTISTTGTITGGAGSFTTGAFSSNVNITGDINCGNISAGSGTISTTGPINVGSINATSLTTGSGPIDGGAGSFTTGAFSSNVNITGDINCGNIAAGSGTISTTGTVNFGTINGTSLLTGSGPINGGAGSFTTGAFSSNVNITGATNGLIISGGFSGLFCNKIESQSGGAIVSSAVFNLRNALAVTNIVLDPLGAYRLKINGITGTNSYLFFNNANLFAFFNTSIGANTWSITDLGAISCNSITASTVNATTSLKTNLIEPYTGTTITVNPISNFNWLKSAGNNRIVFRPQSTTDDILQIYQTGSNTPADGFLYFNNNGFLGYFITSSSSWTISKAGAAIFSQINCSGLTATVVQATSYLYAPTLYVANFALQSGSSFGFNAPIQTSGNTINCGVINSSNINSSGTINCGGITCSTIQTNNNTITCGNINSSGNVSAPSMNITNNSNTALILNSGGIHLQNNNWLFGRCKFGDADYAYIAEYDTGDSDRLYLFGSNGIYCNTLPVVVSDKRLKENIEDFIIDNPLEIIDKIRLVEYNRIDNPSKTRVLGYIAQEIQEIFPKAVEIDQTVIKKDENSVLFKKHNDGTDSEEPEREERLALNYSYISMLNTEAIKQLNELVQKQQTLIDKLVKRIEILENK